VEHGVLPLGFLWTIRLNRRISVDELPLPCDGEGSFLFVWSLIWVISPSDEKSAKME